MYEILSLLHETGIMKILLPTMIKIYTILFYSNRKLFVMFWSRFQISKKGRIKRTVNKNTSQLNVSLIQNPFHVRTC